MAPSILAFVALLSTATPFASAACSINVQSSLPPPVVAKGYHARLVHSGLNDPRGIMFDKAGHLLVVDRGAGLKSLTLVDKGGACVGVSDTKVVVDDTSLNHGIELSADGKTLFASTTANVYSYPYNAKTATANTSKRSTVVSNMTNSDHVTRTLLISKKVPGTLLVARGSTANIDPIASDITSGHSQLRRFNLFNRGGRTYNYPYDGELVGWGLRNDVGVAEHPITGGIYAVENSVDNMERDGKDIHNGNPGEKLNFFGYLKGDHGPNYGGNFGYPTCFGAWDTKVIPHNKGITVGSNFAIGTSSPAKDEVCRNQKIAPRLVFTPHMAPLDIKFGQGGYKAWITFHGSFDRTVPKGYKVCYVPFDAAKGDPIPLATTHSACKDIVTNKNPEQCNGGGNCFRPVGLAFDKKGRLFFSSDATGEIYIITKSDGSSVELLS